MSEIQVLLVKPYQYPERTTIPSGLESLQQLVGGFIEVVYPFDDPVAIICNEEGKINGLPPNRALYDEAGNVADVIAGDFLVVGIGEEDLASLPDALAQKYEKRFHAPEDFLQIGDRIIVLPDDSVPDLL